MGIRILTEVRMSVISLFTVLVRIRIKNVNERSLISYAKCVCRMCCNEEPSTVWVAKMCILLALEDNTKKDKWPRKL